MKEMNEQRNKFGFAAGVNNDIRNECLNSPEEKFECRNVWFGDTEASTHMSMVHSGFKTTTKGKVKTCFAVDSDEVEAEEFREWKGRCCAMMGKGQFDKADTVNLSKVFQL